MKMTTEEDYLHQKMRFYDFSVKLLKMPKNPHKNFWIALICMVLNVDLTDMIIWYSFNSKKENHKNSEAFVNS